jgi:hypothetical protein
MGATSPAPPPRRPHPLGPAGKSAFKGEGPEQEPGCGEQGQSFQDRMAAAAGTPAGAPPVPHTPLDALIPKRKAIPPPPAGPGYRPPAELPTPQTATQHLPAQYPHPVPGATPAGYPLQLAYPHHPAGLPPQHPLVTPVAGTGGGWPAIGVQPLDGACHTSAAAQLAAAKRTLHFTPSPTFAPQGPPHLGPHPALQPHSAAGGSHGLAPQHGPTPQPHASQAEEEAAPNTITRALAGLLAELDAEVAAVKSEKAKHSQR